MLGELHDAAISAVGSNCCGGGTGIAGLVEEELAEIAVGAELSILRPLEGRAIIGLCQRIGIERRRAVAVGIMNQSPFGVEHVAVGVQILIVDPDFWTII